MKAKSVLVNGVAVMCMLVGVAAMADNTANAKLIERGRYLVAASGCNDCHTPGYAQADGKVPVEQWLTGSTVGFQGPWGTTYPTNLRLTASRLTEEQWLLIARAPMRPPMPWFNLRDMQDNDLRAMYRFMRSLQPTGNAAPGYAAPGVTVITPYIDFVPKNPNRIAQVAK